MITVLLQEQRWPLSHPPPQQHPSPDNLNWVHSKCELVLKYASLWSNNGRRMQKCVWEPLFCTSCKKCYLFPLKLHCLYFCVITFIAYISVPMSLNHIPTGEFTFALIEIWWHVHVETEAEISTVLLSRARKRPCFKSHISRKNRCVPMWTVRMCEQVNGPTCWHTQLNGHTWSQKLHTQFWRHGDTIKVAIEMLCSSSVCSKWQWSPY